MKSTLNGNGELRPADPEAGAADQHATPARVVFENGAANGHGYHYEEKPALALFCHDGPDSYIGGHAAQLARALARRGTPVHLFTRHPFDLDAPGVQVHAVGPEDTGDLFDGVRQFTRRASSAFLERFPADRDVTLLGCEWTGAGPLTVLRESRVYRAMLSLHSLERQRSDMSSEISRQIAAAEMAGLRAASTVLVHEPAAAEVIKLWAPDCLDRVVQARSLFPIEQFQGVTDPGAIKGRYQVGPVDPTILYLGDLSERYGPDLLVKAMPAVLKNNRQVRLIVSGDGDLHWPLRVYCRYLLLEHAVRLPGSVEGQAARELIQSADLVVVPSREATPWWPILAAWAAGRPVVATHQAAPGLLEHGKDAVLVYPNEGSCVWGIECILNDPAFARTLARRGREKLEERFGWNAVAEQVGELMGAAASV